MAGRLTFITTNVLQVYGNYAPRFVRVAYELIEDKAKDKARREFNKGTPKEASSNYITYKLVRKESHEVEDVKMKVSEFDYEKVAQQVVREYVVADNIKSFHVEYITFKQEEPEEKKQEKENETIAKAKGTLNKPKEELRSFTWGDMSYSHGVVPHRVEITIVFWNKDGLGDHFFHTMVPIFSYPTDQSDDVKKALDDQQKEQKDQEGQKDAKQASLTQAITPGGKPNA